MLESVNKSLQVAQVNMLYLKYINHHTQSSTFP